MTLPNFVRVQLYGAFATLALGMRVLAAEGVAVDTILAHGGLFRTQGVPQRLLAAAICAPVAVGATASEGGAWGIAALASYLSATPGQGLSEYLRERVFAGAAPDVIEPEARDVAGFAVYLERYAAGLAVERAAVNNVQ